MCVGCLRRRVTWSGKIRQCKREHFFGSQLSGDEENSVKRSGEELEDEGKRKKSEGAEEVGKDCDKKVSLGRAGKRNLWRDSLGVRLL